MTTRLTLLISHAPTQAQRRLQLFRRMSPWRSRSSCERSPRSAGRRQGYSESGRPPERQTQQTLPRLLVCQPQSRLSWCDCDYGAWRGRELDELQTSEPEGIVAWLTDASASPHGGESIVDLINRVGRWLDEQRDAGHTLAVTHPAVIPAGRSCMLCRHRPRHSGASILRRSPSQNLRFNGMVWTVRSTACPLRRTEGRD